VEFLLPSRSQVLSSQPPVHNSLSIELQRHLTDYK
jgi:hypothetical protein